jgi:hypothetical protein
MKDIVTRFRLPSEAPQVQEAQGESNTQRKKQKYIMKTISKRYHKKKAIRNKQGLPPPQHPAKKMMAARPAVQQLPNSK